MSLMEVQNVVFACPGNTAETYERGARPLATFYADLLGMRIVREDWFVIQYEDEPDGLRLAFGDGPIDYQPPRWPDPAFPQQMHLDISVQDLNAVHQRAVALGATQLKDNQTFRVYADPAGHPFCLYPGESDDPTTSARLARVARIVVDCLSPRSLAAFYAPLLDMPIRELDTPHRVVLERPDPHQPALAFQHAVFRAPRWPDPAYPQQVHLDLRVPTPDESRLRAARSLADQLGGILLKASANHHVYTDPSGHPFCI